MIGAGSRYGDADRFSVRTHTYESDGILTEDPDTKEPYVEYRDTLYRYTALPLPDPPETQYMVKQDADISLIAHVALKDPQKWWVVADANPQIRHPFDYSVGDVIYLPI